MATYFEATLFIFLVLAISAGTLTVLLFKQFYCTKTDESDEIPISYKFLNETAFLSVFTLFILGLYLSIRGILHIAMSFTTSYDQLIFEILLNVSWCFHYTFLLLRAYYSFQGSTHEVKKSLLFAHSFIIIFTISLPIIELFSVEARNICGTIVYGFIVIGTIHTIYLFNRNLWLVIRESFNGDVSQFKNDDLVSSLVRHTVLGTLNSIGLVICIFIHGYNSSTLLNQIIAVHVGTCLFIGCSMTLYLGFSVNKPLYFKLCAKSNTFTLEWYTHRVSKYRTHQNEKSEASEL